MKHGITWKKVFCIMLSAAMLCTCLSVPVFAEPEAAEQTVVDPLTEWGQYDALIEGIRTETDQAARAELIRQAEGMLEATHAVIPVNYYNIAFLMKDYVSGIYTDVYGTPYLMYSEMANDAEALNAFIGMYVYTLDPVFAGSQEDFTAVKQLFSGLYTYNEAGEIVPACAEGYTVSEDGLTYTVTLKEGLKWSDGTDLTAGDFEYAWKRAVSYVADYSYLFATLNGDMYGDITDLQVTAVDDRTLQFVVAYPGAPVEDLLTYPVFCPLPASYVEEHQSAEDPGAWSLEGIYPSNGAYMITEWYSEGAAVLEKNPYWYDADRVHTEKIVMSFGADNPSLPYQSYTEGGLDFTAAIPDDVLLKLVQNNDPELVNAPVLGTNYLTINCKSPVFEGKTPQQAAAIREAVSLLIDRSSICSDVLLGRGIPAYSYLPAGMSDGNGGTIGSSQEQPDPAAAAQKARELLEGAGFVFDESGMLSAETPLAFSAAHNGTDQMTKLFDAISQDLASVGITLSVETMDFRQLNDFKNSGNAEILRGGWICDVNDPYDMLEQMTSYNAGSFCGFGAAQ